MLSFDPRGDRPLYQQVRDQLRKLVVSGYWPQGGAIWSERDLMRRTGLSRMTIRQAIAELVHEGVLRRDQGRGTFVVSSGVSQLVHGVYSFTESVRAQGKAPSSKVVTLSKEPVDPESAAELALDAGDLVYRVERVRLVDDEPIMVDAVRIPAALCPGLEKQDLSGSLYQVLRMVYGLIPARSSDTIGAVLADDRLAALLAVDPGAPLTLMRRLARTADGTPMELTEEVARADRCRYRLDLVAESAVFELR